jgi:hypothetical protein
MLTTDPLYCAGMPTNLSAATLAVSVAEVGK